MQEAGGARGGALQPPAEGGHEWRDDGCQAPPELAGPQPLQSGPGLPQLQERGAQECTQLGQHDCEWAWQRWEEFG